MRMILAGAAILAAAGGSAWALSGSADTGLEAAVQRCYNPVQNVPDAELVASIDLDETGNVIGISIDEVRGGGNQAERLETAVKRAVQRCQPYEIGEAGRFVIILRNG